MTDSPPSRLPLPSWSLDSSLIPEAPSSAFLQPFTRSITEETCGPFSMMTLPLPASLSTMYWQAIWPACTLSVVTAASDPSA